MPCAPTDTVRRRYIGAITTTGQWVRVKIPAIGVGVERWTLNGVAFTLDDGTAIWDSAGVVQP